MYTYPVPASGLITTGNTGEENSNSISSSSITFNASIKYLGLNPISKSLPETVL